MRPCGARLCALQKGRKKVQPNRSTRIAQRVQRVLSGRRYSQTQSPTKDLPQKGSSTPSSHNQNVYVYANINDTYLVIITLTPRKFSLAMASDTTDHPSEKIRVRWTHTDTRLLGRPMG